MKVHIKLQGAVVRNMIQELQSGQLAWYGHVQRMADNRLSKQASNAVETTME
jgi:hypothetical protein